MNHIIILNDGRKVEVQKVEENVIDIGVEIPPFLMPLVKNIKSQAEKSVQVEDEKKEED